MSFPILIFAAGFGTRMGQLTVDQPKPLIPVSGKPLIDHTLDIAREISPPRIAANLHYKPMALADHLAKQGVITILESPEILETGGGLRHALPVLGHEPVITLNSDAIWSGPNPLKLLAKAWDPSKMDALLMCLNPDRALSHAGTGDFTSDASGCLTRGPGVIYGGVQIIKTDGLSQISETSFSLNILWDKMIENGRLFGLSYPGHWCDVGAPKGSPWPKA